jgi:hypothetical protein
MIVLTLIILDTWEPLFDREFSENGSAMAVRALFYFILVFINSFYLLIVSIKLRKIPLERWFRNLMYFFSTIVFLPAIYFDLIMYWLTLTDSHL